MLLAESFIERNGTLLQILASVLLAAAAGLGGWWLRSRDKTSKTLDYRVLADVAILSHRPDDNLLKVMYLDEEIDNPRIVRIRITNTGTEVIRASEILEPYVVTVGARIVSMVVAEQSAQLLTTFELTAPNYPECEVRLPLATMNPGDSLTLQMLVDGEERTRVTIAGRSEGETRPPMDLDGLEQTRAQVVNRWKLSGGALMIACGILAILVKPSWPWLPGAISACFTGGAFLAIDAWISWSSARYRTHADVGP